MRAIVNTGTNRLEMLDLPMPEPGAGQVRIHTGAVGICATDLQMVAGWERNGFPAIPGHEWSGTVDAVGEGINESLIGQRCVAENVLSDGGEVGFEHSGGYAEYFLTDAANVQTLPQGFSFSNAALIEPLAVSVRALNRLGPDAAGPMVIFGDGPIGLILALLLSRKGFEVVLVGGRANRLDIALQFGAHQALNYHDFQEDLVSEVRSRTGREFPTVIEASGSGSAMDSAMEMVAKDGNVLLVGDYGGARANFLWNLVLWHEINLIGSNASAGAWPDAVKLAVNEQLPIGKLITHRLPASEFAKGFEIMRNRESNAIKVILEWR